jgi:hypothetical protein
MDWTTGLIVQIVAGFAGAHLLQRRCMSIALAGSDTTWSD